MTNSGLKFKVGDRVKVIRIDIPDGIYYYQYIGLSGVIKHIRDASEYQFEVVFDSKDLQRLELRNHISFKSNELTFYQKHKQLMLFEL